MRMRNALALLFLLAVIAGLRAESLPEWLIPLREAVYGQELSANECNSLYQAAKDATKENCAGVSLDLALSRCEYLMGRALQYEKRNNEATVHYTEGMRLAEKAIADAPSAEAWQMLAENLSQNCVVRSTSYVIANGLNVGKYAKNALSFDKRNAAAQLIIAARWVYAPAPLHNHKKGIEMMKAILENGDMDKDDRFNAHVAIGYAYVQQKKYAEAAPWLLQSLEIYPTNKFAAELLSEK